MMFRIILLWLAIVIVCAGCDGVLKKQNEATSTFDLYFNLGEQSEMMGDNELAVSYFEEALKHSDKNNVANTAVAYNYLGQIALRQGKYNVAMECFHNALNIRIKQKDVEGEASAYRNIGAAYMMAGYFEQAQDLYEQSIELFRRTDNQTEVAACLINLGELYIEQNMPQKALEYYYESKKIFDNAENNADNADMQLWKLFYNIGYTYYLMNETEAAREYYSQMLDLAQAMTNPSSLAETYRLMGHFFDDVMQPDSAIYYYGKAIDIAHSNEMYGILYDALEKRSRLFAMDNQYRQAYHDLMAYGYAYDEVHNSEMIKLFTQRSMQFEFDMQQREQLFRNRIQQIVIWGLAIVALLVGVLGLVLYRGNVQKKRVNATLEKQNDILEHQKAEIAEKNQSITDSIRYASLIQKATLPAKEYTDRALPEHFIYYKPRDIVSGDFYWIDSADDYIIIAAADCTGHGVPGAIVSMLGISTLTKIVGKMAFPKADEILNELRAEIIQLLNPVGSVDTRQDGMDIALVIINTKNREIEYAGAYNPLYLIRNGELIEKKADRMPIGMYVKKDVPFTANRFEYMTGDTVYLFSDGYHDQFGGDSGAKFKTKNFKELLTNINHYPLEEQERIIDEKHLEWRGDIQQIDDILVVGIRLE